MRILSILLSILVLSWALSAQALHFPLPPADIDVVGHGQQTVVTTGDNFATIAHRYDVGYYELIEANPSIDPKAPLPGTVLMVPSRYILPPVPREGLIINLAELRVYYYPKHVKEVWTYPVAIGREGWETPLGLKHVTHKQAKPIWYVPETVRKYRAKEGVFLPKMVLPGPDNPLGEYMLRLDHSSYLIHGTNDLTVIGRRETAGCLRLFPEDIAEMFGSISVGVPVRIINDQYKVGVAEGHLYLEAHVPVLEKNEALDRGFEGLVEKIVSRTEKLPFEVDWDSVVIVGQNKSGIPEVVGHLTESEMVDAEFIRSDENF